MVTMNDILAFIKKAMDNNYDIECRCYGIKIFHNNKEIEFILGHDCGNDVISFITTNHGHLEYIVLTEQEILKWKILKIECRRYQHNKAVNYFDNFFKEKSRRLTNIINDLDDKED